MHRTYRYDPEDDPRLEGFLNGGYKDTILIDVVYRNGLLDGPYRNAENNFVVETGFFKNGEESGEWHHYQRKAIVQGIKTIYLEEPVLVRHYTIPEEPVTGKSVIVRNEILNLNEIDRNEYMLPFDSYFEPFCTFYQLYTAEEEEGLELPEESSRSYAGTEEPDYRYEEYGEVSSVKDIDFSYGNYEREMKVLLNGRRLRTGVQSASHPQQSLHIQVLRPVLRV